MEQDSIKQTVCDEPAFRSVCLGLYLSVRVQWLLEREKRHAFASRDSTAQFALPNIFRLPFGRV